MSSRDSVGICTSQQPMYSTERPVQALKEKSVLYSQPDWKASVVQSDSKFLIASSVNTVEKWFSTNLQENFSFERE